MHVCIYVLVIMLRGVTVEHVYVCMYVCMYICACDYAQWSHSPCRIAEVLTNMCSCVHKWNIHTYIVDPPAYINT